MSKYRGLVLGKFMPFHKGHEYLIRFAREHCQELDVVVGTNRDEPIPGHLRYEWVKKTFAYDPKINVIWYPNSLPQAPKDENDDKFWADWKHALLVDCHARPVEYDYVFTSEQYGWKLSEMLNATHVPVNVDRSIIPVSGTLIRSNPWENWKYLTAEARPYFLKKVVIAGAESCGKTTLARDLAKLYKTIYVPEYGRDYYEMRNQGSADIRFEHLDDIAIGHVASTHAAARSANRIMFIDTDPFATCLFSLAYFGKVSDRVLIEMENWHVDLTVVCAPVIPWVKDNLRDMPDTRKKFHEDYLELLTKHHQKFIIMDNPCEDRAKDLVGTFSLMGITNPTGVVGQSDELAA